MTLPLFSTTRSGYARIPSSSSKTAGMVTTPLISSPASHSTDTLVVEDPPSPSLTKLSTWTRLSNPKWANIKARLPALESGTLTNVLFDYVAYCVTFAFISAVCSALLNLLGALVLALGGEPYTNHGVELVGAGAMGGAILSVGFVTIAWTHNRLETIYERTHKIYAQPSDLPLSRLRRNEDPTLAHRHRDAVTKWCFIVAAPVCGIVGPAVGVLILNRYSMAEGALTTAHGFACGGAGVAVIAGITILCRSVCYVADCSCDGDDD
ncbi:hypothetical protein FOMPIDRAFT_1020489 [Fomitopsis schrenkii]|uniref:Transmembrane protein n=1 Tax=Fomitopsis schrenkii TaxID=2126942 RepID=S8DQT4_FOMSC|nr:hypothetical protein FOMPIDRAFT_1020489 [Fomitopsis schrenkii]